MTYVQLTFQQQGQIAVVTLDRPEMRHAFNTVMAEELLAIFQQVNNDDVRVVILTSSTPEAFCSGADLKERKGMGDDVWRAQHKLFEEMFQAVANIKAPTIAAIRGYALAGGFELALNTDIIIAGNNVQVGLTEVQRGIMPGGGGARLLPKRIAPHIAKEWLFTGRIVQTNEAQAAGLFNRVVPQEEVLTEALALAEQIAENAPIGVRGVKKVADSSNLPMAEALAIEVATYKGVIDTEDRLEGILAFNEKRKPKFIGK
ncbi:MAG: enoyl-CoA hydratase-related protein [Solibacillus sp.]